MLIWKKGLPNGLTAIWFLTVAPRPVVRAPQSGLGLKSSMLNFCSLKNRCSCSSGSPPIDPSESSLEVTSCPCSVLRHSQLRTLSGPRAPLPRPHAFTPPSELRGPGAPLPRPHASTVRPELSEDWELISRVLAPSLSDPNSRVLRPPLSAANPAGLLGCHGTRDSLKITLPARSSCNAAVDWLCGAFGRRGLLRRARDCRGPGRCGWDENWSLHRGGRWKSDLVTEYYHGPLRFRSDSPEICNLSP